MHCPFCGCEETQVKDTRLTEEGMVIRRRRSCINKDCMSRFTTFERVQLRPLIVIKKDGSKKFFDREKLKKSIDIAVRKRDISSEQVDLLVNNITKQLENKGESEISSQTIGKLTMETLLPIDKVSYVRFASVYRDFRDTEDFSSFIEDIKKIEEN